MVFSALLVAQEEHKRHPADMLPPQYAGILLAEDRVGREKPDEVVQFMGLRDGNIVADVGCGNGFFTLRLADEVGPHGVVFAVDVQQGMLDQLIERQKEAGIFNIYPVLGEYEDPMLPPGKIDWILLVDAYHEFSHPEAMLARIKESLAPGGRVVLIEYRGEGDSKVGGFPIPRDHSMTVEEVMNEWLPAGFELVTQTDFLPTQHLFIFKNADDATRPAIRAYKAGKTPRVSTFDNRVYFSGLPDEAALQQFADIGVKTVVNLQTSQELSGLSFDEKSVVEGAGMTYLHAPMGFELPDTASLENVMNALDAAGEAPVLLHCGSSSRSGAIWAVYAGQRANLSIDEAIAEGVAAGMNPGAYGQAVREALSK